MRRYKSRQKAIRPRILNPAHLARIARLFRILSEPSRLSVLHALQHGPLSVSQLVAECSLKQANVSKQLAVLHDHCLVRRSRAGTSVYYEIADPFVFSLCDLACGKMERDLKAAAALFAPEI